jgi:hypothetical protein
LSGFIESIGSTFFGQFPNESLFFPCCLQAGAWRERRSGGRARLPDEPRLDRDHSIRQLAEGLPPILPQRSA